MKYKGIKKLYYSISEISDKLGIKPSVIRYWETEFKDLSPQKNRAGNRIYKEDDIDTIRLIHHYVHEKHLSIHDANELIQDLKKEHLYKRKVKELSTIVPEPMTEETSDPEIEEDIIETPPEPEVIKEETVKHDLPFDEGFKIISKDEKLISKLEPFVEVVNEEEFKDEKTEPVFQTDLEFEIVSPTKETFIYPLDEKVDEEDDIEETDNGSISLDTTPELPAQPDPVTQMTTDPEVKELLKKIAGNINDIIGILNE